MSLHDCLNSERSQPLMLRNNTRLLVCIIPNVLDEVEALHSKVLQHLNKKTSSSFIDTSLLKHHMNSIKKVCMSLA